MMRILSTLMLCAMVIAGTCDAVAAETISFARDIASVLNARCASCHLTGQEDGNLALEPSAAYASLVGKPSVESDLLRVKPGSPQQSYLLLKVEGRHLDAGGTGARMPFGATPLDATTIDLLRQWIADGALP